MTEVKNGLFKKKLLAAAILAPAVMFAGCSSNDGAQIPGESTGEASGIAYDGYLNNAIVCVDTNLNKVCDDGEPETKSGKGGLFVFKGLTDPQQRYPYVLEAQAGVTLDEGTNAPVPADFSYLAPPRSLTVSALSTFVQVNAEENIAAGDSVADALRKAKAALAEDLGLGDRDPTAYDPIAIAKENSTESDLAARIALVNQASTQAIVRALQTANTRNDKLAQPFTPDAVYFAVAKQARENVPTIKTNIDQLVLDSGFSAPDLSNESIAQIVDTSIGADSGVTLDVKPADIADALSTIDAAQTAIVKDIEDQTGEDQPAPEAPTGATGGTGGSSGSGQGTN